MCCKYYVNNTDFGRIIVETLFWGVLEDNNLLDLIEIYRRRYRY